MKQRGYRGTDKLWRIIGTRHGREFTVRVRAADYNAAYRKGSRAPHWMVVTSVFLLDDKPATPTKGTR